MKEVRVLEKLKKGESLTVEFKESKNKLNKNVFEPVCAFLNRNGGHLFLGVKDDGEILGIEKDSVSKIKDNFVTLINNPDKINPTFYLNIQEIEIKGRTILYIVVPESSQVHRCNGKIYDRNEDADIDLTINTNLVSGMYMRKQSTYSENTIFPLVSLEELRTDIF